MEKEEAERIAKSVATKWYKEEYGGYHWATADEVVEDFLIWLLSKKPQEGKYCSDGVG